MAKGLAKQIDVVELKALQGGNVSKGFVALNKLSNSQLLDIGNTLLAAQGVDKPRGNAYTAFALLVGHAAPTTAAEALFIGLRWFVDAKTTNIEMFSTISVWHSTPAKVARRYNAKGGLARYDANNALSFGGYKLVCVTHKLTQQRADCVKSCVQGLVSGETGKTLYGVATKRVFDVGTTSTSTTRKPRARRKANPPTDAVQAAAKQIEAVKVVEVPSTDN